MFQISSHKNLKKIYKIGTLYQSNKQYAKYGCFDFLNYKCEFLKEMLRISIQ